MTRPKYVNMFCFPTVYVFYYFCYPGSILLIMFALKDVTIWPTDDDVKEVCYAEATSHDKCGSEVCALAKKKKKTRVMMTF